MEAQRAIELANQIRTYPENIVREEYEMIFLKEILESKEGKNFIFKGGTALRLAYNSIRFSEDIDFSLREKISWPSMKVILEKKAFDFETIKIKELREKYYTYFALFSIKEAFLPQPFLLKTEISKRPVNWEKEKDYKLTQLKSPTSILATAGFVVTLPRVYKDKKRALKERVKGRDLFDFWWVRQQLRKEEKTFSNGRFRIKRREIEGELKRFLPKGNWWSIKEFFPNKHEH